MPGESPPKPVTLRDIAAVAGVSVATVSLALREHARIPVITRKKVQRAARRLGYQPDRTVHLAMAKIRSPHRTVYRETLAFLSPHPFDPFAPQHWAGRLMCAGARERALQLGYGFEPFWCRDPKVSDRRLSDILVARGIRGLVIAPFSDHGAALELDWTRFSAVAIGFTLVTPELHRAGRHTENAAHAAFRFLAARGCQRVGLAIDDRQNRSMNNRAIEANFALIQRDLPIGQRVPMLIARDWSPEAFARWYRKHCPDGVIGGNVKTDEWLRHVAGPRRVAFASITRRREDRVTPGLYPNFEIIAASAVELATVALERGEFGVPRFPRVVLVEGDWSDGTGIAPLAGHART